MLNLSTRQLEAFVMVATTGTVRSAAERLHLTQPAVSMALSELERHLGSPLFHRERGRLRLNDYGVELLPQARDVLERLHDLARPPGAGPRHLTGELHIGASNTIGNYLVGDLLADFMRQEPGVALQVSVENTTAIMRGLLERRLDIGCVEGPSHHPALTSLPWRDDDLVVCAAPGHPLAARPALRARDFDQVGWILREPGSAMRLQTEQALALLPPGRIVLELGQVEAIKQAVTAGLGIACLPAVAVVDAAAVGRLRILPTPFLPLRRRLSLLLHASPYRSAIVSRYLQSLGIDSAAGLPDA